MDELNARGGIFDTNRLLLLEMKTYLRFQEHKSID